MEPSRLRKLPLVQNVAACVLRRLGAVIHQPAAPAASPGLPISPAPPPPGPGPLAEASFLQQQVSQLVTTGEEAVAGRGTVAEDMKARGVMSTSPGGLCGLSALGLETFPQEMCPPHLSLGSGSLAEGKWNRKGMELLWPQRRRQVGHSCPSCTTAEPRILTAEPDGSPSPVCLSSWVRKNQRSPHGLPLGVGQTCKGIQRWNLAGGAGFLHLSLMNPSLTSPPSASSSSLLLLWSYPSSPPAALVGRATCMGTCRGAARASLLPLSQPFPPCPGFSPPTPASLTHSPASLRPEHFVCKVLSDATLRGAVNQSTGASPSLRR
ncbi:uncharacterized protein LOC116494652 [Aythya fuligula]|uniref:Uncharacterized protein LOC116494652 n=1 Tax=Aythya fuligula TaxID=219594 RepID=A0A6J3DM13_AYTFU|nr:uncharacterized protein LOC116494652 [Aythya fuligula]